MIFVFQCSLWTLLTTNMINMNVFIQMAQSVRRQTLSQVQYSDPVSCIPGNWIPCILFLGQSFMLFRWQLRLQTLHLNASAEML